MTIIWLIVWLIKGTPSIHFWEAWTIALTVCAGVDLFGGGSAIR